MDTLGLYTIFYPIFSHTHLADWDCFFLPFGNSLVKHKMRLRFSIARFVYLRVANKQQLAPGPHLNPLLGCASPSLKWVTCNNHITSQLYMWNIPQWGDAAASPLSDLALSQKVGEHLQISWCKTSSSLLKC